MMSPHWTLAPPYGFGTPFGKSWIRHWRWYHNMFSPTIYYSVKQLFHEWTHHRSNFQTNCSLGSNFWPVMKTVTRRSHFLHFVHLPSLPYHNYRGLKIKASKPQPQCPCLNYSCYSSRKKLNNFEFFQHWIQKWRGFQNFLMVAIPGHDFIFRPDWTCCRSTLIYLVKKRKVAWSAR